MLTLQNIQLFLVAAIVVLAILSLLMSKSGEKKDTFKKIDGGSWADQESMAVITKSMERAQDLLFQAESESLTIVEKARMGMKAFEEEHNKKFAEALQESEKELRLVVEGGTQGYKHLLARMEQESEDLHEQAKKTMNEHIEKTLAAFDKNISTHVAEAQKKGIAHIEQETAAVQSAIAEYKQKRMQAVDEHIVEILEKTMGLVLRNSLKLQDHMELVFEALEKAKSEKFFE